MSANFSFISLGASVPLDHLAHSHIDLVAWKDVSRRLAGVFANIEKHGLDHDEETIGPAFESACETKKCPAPSECAFELPTMENAVDSSDYNYETDASRFISSVVVGFEEIDPFDVAFWIEVGRRLAAVFANCEEDELDHDEGAMGQACECACDAKKCSPPSGSPTKLSTIAGVVDPSEYDGETDASSTSDFIPSMADFREIDTLDLAAWKEVGRRLAAVLANCKEDKLDQDEGTIAHAFESAWDTKKSSPPSECPTDLSTIDGAVDSSDYDGETDASSALEFISSAAGFEESDTFDLVAWKDVSRRLAAVFANYEEDELERDKGTTGYAFESVCYTKNCSPPSESPTELSPIHGAVDVSHYDGETDASSASEFAPSEEIDTFDPVAWKEVSRRLAAVLANCEEDELDSDNKSIVDSFQSARDREHCSPTSLSSGVSSDLHKASQV